MKIKNAILSLILCFCAILGVTTLSGCGDTSLKTLAENFDDLDTIYAEQTEAGVFKTGDCKGMQTQYLMSYGQIVDEYVADQKDEYVELLEVYNVALVVSSDYIDNNKTYITNMTKEKLTNSAQSAINTLNASVVAYKNAFTDFLRERQTLIKYFELNNGKLEEKDHLINLRKFKKAYGTFVEKNIEVSSNLAKCVETTEIFELLKKAEPTVDDTKVVKEYVRAKLLPIYTQFRISELENNLNWNASAETETKTRIDNLLSKLDESFTEYKSKFVGSNDSSLKTLQSKDEMSKLFDYIDDFFVEAQSYYTALEKLDISSLAVGYENDLEKYKNTNKMAEVYLEKLEQFVGTTLPNFTEKVVSTIMN